MLDDEVIISPDQNQNYFYLIKSGEVKLLDRYYNYMYHLNEGSFFGEQHIILGILTDNFYKHSTKAKRIEGEKVERGMLYRIKAARFMEIIVEDFSTFKYFF